MSGQTLDAPAKYPNILVGGPHHGKRYDGLDCPRTLQLPVMPTVDRSFLEPFHEHTVTVETAYYVRSCCRFGPWKTDFWYYRSEDLDEAEGHFQVFALLWENMILTAKRGGWGVDELCHYCNGSGKEPRS